jgi:hypothetical protein
MRTAMLSGFLFERSCLLGVKLPRGCKRDYGAIRIWLHSVPTHLSSQHCLFRSSDIGKKQRSCGSEVNYDWPTAKTGGVIQVVRQKYIQVSEFKYYLCQKVFPKAIFYSLATDL